MATIDQNRLRTFGQNMTTCLRLIDKSFEQFAADTGISAKILEQLQTGKVQLSIDKLQLIASELNIAPRHLTQTYASEERRKQSLSALLAEVGHSVGDYSSEEVIATINTEPKLPRTIRVIQPAIGSEKVFEIKEKAERVSKPSATDFKVRTKNPKQAELPERSPSEDRNKFAKPEATKPVTKKAKLKPPVVEEIDPAYIMTFDGVDYNLRDKELRIAIADRIRFARGKTPSNVLAEGLSRKRTYSWFVSLSGVSPQEIEEIAELCSVTAHCLVTGEGIVGVSASEATSDWLKRYVANSTDGHNVLKAAQTILKDLEKWPPAIQHMLLKYLLEVS